jgi:hypothetical protein
VRLAILPADFVGLGGLLSGVVMHGCELLVGADWPEPLSGQPGLLFPTKD